MTEQLVQSSQILYAALQAGVLTIRVQFNRQNEEGNFRVSLSQGNAPGSVIVSIFDRFPGIPNGGMATRTLKVNLPQSSIVTIRTAGNKILSLPVVNTTNTGALLIMRCPKVEQHEQQQINQVIRAGGIRNLSKLPFK